MINFCKRETVLNFTYVYSIAIERCSTLVALARSQEVNLSSVTMNAKDLMNAAFSGWNLSIVVGRMENLNSIIRKNI